MPKILKIHSENNDFQHIEVIKRNRNKRHKSREFFVEGVNSINRVIENNWSIKAFVYTDYSKVSVWCRAILKNTTADFHFEVAQRLMKKLSDKSETSELMAIVKMPEDDLNRIHLSDNPLIVILDRPVNPGNLGTIIRSCDSFNVDGLIITGHSVDLYDPQVIRASVGSFFSIPVVRLESHSLVQEWVGQLENNINIQVVGSSAKADKLISEFNFTGPTIFLLGNETKGLSENYKSICDDIVKIPIFGSATSLNVACAASISLYEINRQRVSK